MASSKLFVLYDYFHFHFLMHKITDMLVTRLVITINRIYHSSNIIIIIRSMQGCK